MAPFNTAAFPDSLALGKQESLLIGTIDDIQVCGCGSGSRQHLQATAPAHTVRCSLCRTVQQGHYRKRGGKAGCHH
jgi:LSD1 subclass zinc finger protein